MAAPFDMSKATPPPTPDAESAAVTGANSSTTTQKATRRWWWRPEWATPAPAGYRYEVKYDQARSEIRIKRVRRIPDTRHEQHRMLAEVMSRQTVLPKARVSVTMTDIETGAPTGYRISYDTTFKTGDANVQKVISAALTAQVGETEDRPERRDAEGTIIPRRLWATRWDARNGAIELYLKEAIPTRISHPLWSTPTEIGTGELEHVPYATGEAGEVAYWNMSAKSSSPHALVIGPTGGGKTSAFRTMFTEAVLRGVPLLGIDPKMIELDGMADHPGIASIVTAPMSAARLVRALDSEIMARYTYMRAKKIDPSMMPLLGLGLDEFFILSGIWTQMIKTGTQEEIEELKFLNPLAAISNLAVLARSAGIRLAVGVQRPDAQLFGKASGNTRDQFKTRVSMSALGMDGSMMIWDDAHVGGGVDSSIAGRAMVTNANGKPMLAQVWWTPNVDPHPTVRNALRPAEKKIVEGLTPSAGPEIDCYSQELEDFLRNEQRIKTAPRDTPREPVRVGSTLLDDLGDAIPARSITRGTAILIPATPERGAPLVPGVVDNVEKVAGASKGEFTVELDVRIDPDGGGRPRIERHQFNQFESVFLASSLDT